MLIAVVTILSSPTPLSSWSWPWSSSQPHSSSSSSCWKKLWRGSGCCLGRGSTSLQSHLFRCIFIHILNFFIISSSLFHLIIIVAFNENDILKETIMICWRNIKLQNGVLQSYRVVPLFMQEPTACIQAASDLTNPGALTLSCVHCKPPLRYL